MQCTVLSGDSPVEAERLRLSRARTGAFRKKLGRVLDAARLAAVVVSGVLSRRPVRPRGDEDRRPLPGDDVVTTPKLQWTHGITIRAGPADVWPWIVQMGCRRAGWYSYDGLDNDGVPSADRIVPELQRVEVGAIFPWTPKAEDGFVVRAVEHERALVLGDAAGTFTWALILEPIAETSSRLVVRARGWYERVAVGLMLRLVWRPIHFGMQRRQLLNLKRRVEATGR